MRILFAAHQFFPDHSAGVEIVTLGWARELKARGHEPRVLAAKRSAPHSDLLPGEVEDYEYGGIQVRRVGRPQEGPTRPYHLNFRNEVMAQRAREYVREVEPDIVHVVHLQGLSASVVPVFKEIGVPVVFTATDFWTVCPVVDLRRHDGVLCEGPELAHCVRCIASRNTDPRMKTMVGRVPNAALRAAGALSRTPLSRLSGALRQVGDVRERAGYIREKMEPVDHFVAYTRLSRDLLSSNGVGTGKTEVSHYGIDTSNTTKAPKNRKGPPPLRVGFIGTLAPHKGCDVLVRAFRSLPPGSGATLTLHGNLKDYGPYVDELLELAGDDARITFPGAFPREGLGSVLSETDVLVVPSRWYENAPGVIFEAFAAGVPVVATDLGGLSEFVRPGENGLLFELENAEDLARQLRRLAEEPGLLERLRAGIGPVKTVGENANELEEVYNALLRKKRAE